MEIFIALTVSMLLSSLIVLATRGERRRTGIFWLFLMIFLATWAGGIWLRPFGPTLWGAHWLTFLLVGMIIALVFTISPAKRPPRDRRETLDMLERIEKEKQLESATYVTLSAFFWLLLVVLALAIIVRYV